MSLKSFTQFVSVVLFVFTGYATPDGQAQVP